MIYRSVLFPIIPRPTSQVVRFHSMSHAEAHENTRRVSNNRVRSFRSVAARAMPLCDKWVALKTVEFVSTGLVFFCIVTRHTRFYDKPQNTVEKNTTPNH